MRVSILNFVIFLSIFFNNYDYGLKIAEDVEKIHVVQRDNLKEKF